MQTVQQSKIENMAATIYETGNLPQPGNEIVWFMPSRYDSHITIQRRAEATAEECAQAERLAERWWAGRFSA